MVLWRITSLSERVRVMIRIDLASLIDRLSPVCRQAVEEAASLCISQHCAEITVAHVQSAAAVDAADDARYQRAMRETPAAEALELTHTEAPSLPGHAAGADLLHGLLHTDNLPQAMDAFQSLVIRARLRQVNGSRSRAALSLGIPKRTLARRCQAWNLDREDHTS